MIDGWLGAAEELLRVSAGEAVGTPLADLCRRRADRERLSPAGLALAGGLDAVLELRQGRGSFQAAVTISPRLDRPGMVALIRGMQPALRPDTANPELWKGTLGMALKNVLESAGPGLRGLETVEDLAPLLVTHMRRLLPGFECILSVVPSDRPNRFQIKAGSGVWSESLVGNEWDQRGTVAGLAMRSRRTIETVEIQARSGLRETLAGGGIRSGCLVPLLSARPLPDGRRALGVIGFYRREQRFCTPYERRLIEESAGLVTLSLQRAELSRSITETTHRLEVGVDLAVDLAASLDPRDVVRRLLDRTVSATGAERVTLLRVEGEEYVVDDGIDQGHLPAPVGARFPLDAVRAGNRAILQQAVRQRQPVVAAGFRVRGMAPRYRLALRDLTQSVTIPMALAGEVTAVLTVGSRGPIPFGRSQVSTLQLIANVAALALRNAWLYAEAQEASRVKSDFLNMAAHELRTPLTVISGYLSMLEDGSFGEVPEGWNQPVSLLSAKAQELGKLVEDLLLAARLESGRLPTQVVEIDLREAVLSAVARAQARAGLQGASVRAELPGDPVWLEVDPEHLGRILDNLINNGLNYSGEHAQVIARLSSSSDSARIEVEDKGRGIAADYRERIFERFFRVEDRDVPALPGTGLGLHISRELATKHGGTLQLDWTEIGAGSRFLLELPLVQTR